MPAHLGQLAQRKADTKQIHGQKAILGCTCQRALRVERVEHTSNAPELCILPTGLATQTSKQTLSITRS